MRIKPLPLSFRLLLVLLRVDEDAGKVTVGTQWAADRWVVRKENISVGNSFLSVMGA